MWPSQKEKKYKTTIIIIVQQIIFLHTKILHVINITFAQILILLDARTPCPWRL